MRRTILLASVVALVTLAIAPSASAGGAMRASVTIDSIYIMPGDVFPDEVLARCGPSMPQAIVGGTASGQMVSDVYTGPITVTDQHCTLLRLANAQTAVASIHSGQMTIEATEGPGTLEITYKAPGVMHGDAFFGPNVHTFNGPYTITGGTGIFAGATGHGHLGGSAAFDGAVFDAGQIMSGSLLVP
jgi:hypothetical protein